MKKTIALILAMLLVFTCGALAELTFTTGGDSGTYFAYGGVLAEFITSNTDLDIKAVTSGGSAENIDTLDAGQRQLGFVQNDVAYYAYNGIRIYEGEPITSFTALAALYDETVQVVTCNPDIKSVADLKGKTVSIGAAGSGTYFNAIDFLAAYDMTEDDINPVYDAFGTSADKLKDSKIDAAFIVAGAPTTAVVDLSTGKQVYLISLDDEHIDKLLGISDAYAKTTIPAGTYSGIDEDVVTVSVKATIIANEDVTEDEAYTIVSTIFENADKIGHAKAGELDLEYASTCGLPYHPGAAKYFAEKGITVDVAE